MAENSLKIVIDAQALLEPLAGIGHYTSSLIKALASIDGKNEYYLYYGAALRIRKEKLPDFGNPRFHNKFIRVPGKIFRPFAERMHIIPIGAFFSGYDLFHGTNYYAPSIKIPRVVNIYDMSYRLLPDCFTERRLRDINRKVTASAYDCDLIITGSLSAKRDIIRFLGLPSKKIVVIPNGVDERFRPVNDKGKISSIREKYNLPDKFILFVGTIEPRKNIELLIEAFSRLKGEYKLVIAGAFGWKFEGVQKKVRVLRLRGQVHFTGYIPDEDLPLVYNAATIFVYPSLYEGFGFPPLEAMASGVPVVTSTSSSLPEIVGDSGLSVDSHDVEGLKNAMKRLLDDEGLRKELRGKGFLRAKKFSWEECAKRTLEVYRTLAGAP